MLFSLFGSRERKQLPDAQVDLAGVELVVRLPSGVGRALCAALIEIDPVAFDKAPGFPEHALCGQLWRSGEGLMALPHAGVVRKTGL